MPDKYTYANSEVLRNKYNVTDQTTLDRIERGHAALGLADLANNPVAGKFDFPHLQAIHRRLVGDLYEWAGEIRTTDTQAMGTGVAHCRPEFIEAFAAEVFARIAADDFLLNLDHKTFTQRFSHHWGELTALHPFRDGITRSPSAFLDQLSTRAGWEIQWAHLDLDAVKEARIIAISRSSGPLRGLLAPSIIPLPKNNQA